ncbi:MAG: hypothetical protein LBR77_03320 [Lachnospiraceae bacterium]|nr:hypothetical protein [Lachnospiraceae bacterium]
MKRWTKRRKIAIVLVFAVLVAVALIGAWALNAPSAQAGVKRFTLSVTSGRDGYAQTVEYESGEEYLGGFLRTLPACEWQEGAYGLYVTGYGGMGEDLSAQYWWCILEGGEMAAVGADEIPLAEGGSYGLDLRQGW